MMMQRKRRTKLSGVDATYHCMTRVVNGEMLFKNREKEVLRKMIWQLADFCGVEVLTYCVMSNHFHVLLRVPAKQLVDDRELLRRFSVLYPKPTQYQTESLKVLRSQLLAGMEDAAEIRQKLLARMGDVSEYMKAVKQRFSVWYNRNHDRYGTLWSDRFKSVLVEGKGNPLQTMAAYIDLNPVRAGLVEDPKDYRFCGYAEGVAGNDLAVEGLRQVWSDYDSNPLRAHRLLLFGKGGECVSGTSQVSREDALRVLEREDGVLPKSAILRCRVRYFTDGAILGSAAFVEGFVGAWQAERQRRHPPKVNLLKGGDWGDLAVIRGLRKQVFG
jgi:hypothetical protein